MSVATRRAIETDTVMLGVGCLLAAFAVSQYLAGVYGGASAAGIGAVLSFSFAMLLN